MSTIPPAVALTRARTQSLHGPPFPVNTCKVQCRRLYDVPSDGSPSAAVAWTRTRRRHQFHDVPPPAGALVWWTGGAKGYGHVAVYAGQGMVWSTDIKRSGHFDLVPLHTIATSWPSLTLVGWSEDIDGVRVVVAPNPREDLDMTPEELRTIVREEIDRGVERLRTLDIDPGPRRITLAGALRYVFKREEMRR